MTRILDSWAAATVLVGLVGAVIGVALSLLGLLPGGWVDCAVASSVVVLIGWVGCLVVTS